MSLGLLMPHRVVRGETKEVCGNERQEEGSVTRYVMYVKRSKAVPRGKPESKRKRTNPSRGTGKKQTRAG